MDVESPFKRGALFCVFTQKNNIQKEGENSLARAYVYDNEGDKLIALIYNWL